MCGRTGLRGGDSRATIVGRKRQIEPKVCPTLSPTPRSRFLSSTKIPYAAPFGFLNGLLLTGQYHEFRSDVGNLNFGSEFYFYALLPLHEGWYTQFKYANYMAENFPPSPPNPPYEASVKKFIFGLGYKY